VKESCGTLLYQLSNDGSDLKVLLVHPSGNYNRKAPWGIPKGLPDLGETLEGAARRETLEETGVEAAELVDLGHADYVKSRKRIHCFAGPAPADASPRCASWEVDRAEFVPLAEALRVIHLDQAIFIERLLKHLKQEQRSNAPLG
jgi:predicted NUDIX family NTP pyrophosphohydrolase